MKNKIPIEIIQDNKNKILKLKFDDNSDDLSFEFLRAYTPSAEALGHGSEKDRVFPLDISNISINGIEPVGNYAIKIIFSDGHDTGIYSWDYISQLLKNKITFINRYKEFKNNNEKKKNIWLKKSKI